MPIDLLAKERQVVYQQKAAVGKVAVHKAPRDNTMNVWQQKWAAERWVRLIFTSLNFCCTYGDCYIDDALQTFFHCERWYVEHHPVDAPGPRGMAEGHWLH